MAFSARDHFFMAQALRLAENGLYSTSPNPRVGAIVVRGDRIIGSGWHEAAGGPHAEILALQSVKEEAAGSTVYVTLEPCSHQGRTPPCAHALVRAKVSKVVAAMKDPNPLVSGQGFELLEKAGIETGCGLLESEARELNLGFISRMERKIPWVRLKIASSLDGGTALNNGKSRWITSIEARHDVQKLRAASCAILTGIGTVLADDPRLTVREIETKRQPLRVVLDSGLKIPLDARIIEGGVLIAAAVRDPGKEKKLAASGAEVAFLPDDEGKVNIKELLLFLAKRGINEVLVEGGEKLNGAFLRAGFVDEIVQYAAPCLLGSHSRGMFDFPEIDNMDNKISLSVREVRMVGSDLRITSRPNLKPASVRANIE